MDRSRLDSQPSAVDRLTRRTALVAAATGMSLAAFGARHGSTRSAAQATPVASPATGEASFLFVQAGFTSGTLTPDSGDTFALTLRRAPEQTIFFSDRPNRVVGALPTPEFLAVLGFDPSDPPNAALVIQTDDGTTDVIVLELTAPVYDPVAATMSYTATVLEGIAQLESTGVGFTEQPLPPRSIPATFGACSLFVDSLLGCTPIDPRC